MYFEWCSVAVGDTKALRGSFLHCISTSSCYTILPSLVSSNTFIPLCPLTSHTPEQPQPAVPFLPAQACASPSFLGPTPGAAAGSVLSPPRCRRVEQWHCRGGSAVTPAHPPLPKHHGWEHRGCSSGWECGMSPPCGSPGGGRPTEPHIQAEIHPGEWQSRVLFGCSERIMSSLDTN